MQPNQLYVHTRTQKVYRVLLAWVPGRTLEGEWIDGVVYVGAYDGKPRWTDYRRWNASFEKAPGRIVKQIDGDE